MDKQHTWQPLSCIMTIIVMLLTPVAALAEEGTQAVSPALDANTADGLIIVFLIAMLGVGVHLNRKLSD